jgi:excisionase family DNA binding protein
VTARLRLADNLGADAPANDGADDVLDVRQACALLKVSRNTLYDAVAANRVPHRRFGRSIRFSRVALVRWLDSCSVPRAPEGQ